MLTPVNIVTSYEITHSLGQGLANFSLPRAALAIHICQGPQKKNNVGSKRNCIS
jgi:hypothetical protein